MTRSHAPIASALLRDFVRDWKRWTLVERVVAGTLLAILPAAAPVTYIGLSLGAG